MLLYDTVKRNVVVEVLKSTTKKNKFTLFKNGVFVAHYTKKEIEVLVSELLELGYIEVK